MHCGYFLIYCASLTVLVLINPDLSISALWKIPAETPSSEAGRNFGERCSLILLVKYLCHTPQGSLKCRKVLRHETDDFTSLPKEVVLRILSPIRIHRPRPGLNPRAIDQLASTITNRPSRTSSLFCLKPELLYFA
jgi:hypothetical protein